MSFVKLFGFYSVLLSGIRVSSKMELQVGHPNLFTTLHWPLLNRIFKTFSNDIFDKYVFQIIICFIIWKCAQLLLALAIILKIKKLRSSVSDVKVVLYKLYRVAIGAKTSKTVVLPEFCKTERSGGAPPCYRGLAWACLPHGWRPCLRYAYHGLQDLRDQEFFHHQSLRSLWHPTQANCTKYHRCDLYHES